jgi:ferredoxin
MMKPAVFNWPMNVTVQFVPNNCTTTATGGESLLTVADRAGVSIPIGCLRGACYACVVEMNGEEVCSCLTAIPEDCEQVTIALFEDPTW